MQNTRAMIGMMQGEAVMTSKKHCVMHICVAYMMLQTYWDKIMSNADAETIAAFHYLMEAYKNVALLDEAYNDAPHD